MLKPMGSKLVFTGYCSGPCQTLENLSALLPSFYASKIVSHLGHFARPLYAIGMRIAAAH